METKQNDFAAKVAADAAAQKHAQEIQQTRIGGLGGSDAAMIIRIAERGISGLTATDNKRLAIMLGLCPPDDWNGNAYTNAGHAFEDYADRNLPVKNKGRETYMSRELARKFKTFAHADFTEFDENGNVDTVIECKFVQDETGTVLDKYYAQLQWYYMLGAKHVVLYHGQGIAEPFEVSEAVIREVERDEQTIQCLIAGIKLLDNALTDGWTPLVPDKINIENLPEQVRKEFEHLQRIRAYEATLKAEKEHASNVVKEYMETFGLSGIVSDNGEKKVQIIYSQGSITRTFDSVAFLKEHPEYNDDPRYWKQTKRDSSISLK